jgi:hypothetical protein
MCMHVDGRMTSSGTIDGLGLFLRKKEGRGSKSRYRDGRKFLSLLAPFSDASAQYNCLLPSHGRNWVE